MEVFAVFLRDDKKKLIICVNKQNLFFIYSSCFHQSPYFWPSNCWEPENTDYGESHAIPCFSIGEISLMPSAVSFSPQLTSVALWLTLTEY